MNGNSFGQVFRITTWGESHGRAVGVSIDGCPAGLPITTEMVQAELNRRRTGQSSVTTPRQEQDRVEIVAGLFEGETTGMPIAISSGWQPTMLLVSRRPSCSGNSMSTIAHGSGEPSQG